MNFVDLRQSREWFLNIVADDMAEYKDNLIASGLYVDSHAGDHAVAK